MVSHLPSYALREADIWYGNIKFGNFNFSNNQVTSIFKKEITTVLERDLEHNLTYTTPENLAKRVAALYEVYLATDDLDIEQNIFIEDKERYLRQMLVDGENAVFKRYAGDVAEARLNFAETVLMSAPSGDMEKCKKFLGKIGFSDEINAAEKEVIQNYNL